MLASSLERERKREREREGEKIEQIYSAIWISSSRWKVKCSALRETETWIEVWRNAITESFCNEPSS